MSLTSFVLAAYEWMLSFYNLLSSIHPFKDFPSISLLEIMAGVCLISLCMIFVPGFDDETLEDDEEFGDGDLGDTSIDPYWDD